MEDKASGHPSCACGRDIVKYQCQEEKCPNFKDKNLYCQACIKDKNHEHKHFDIEYVKIKIEIETRWRNLEKEYIGFYSSAKERCKQYNKLLEHLNSISKEHESLAPIKPIFDDQSALEKLS